MFFDDVFFMIGVRAARQRREEPGRCTRGTKESFYLWLVINPLNHNFRPRGKPLTAQPADPPLTGLTMPTSQLCTDINSND